MPAADHDATAAVRILKPQSAFSQSSADYKVILSERRDARPVRDLLSLRSTPSSAESSISAALAIGPEGGWTDEELASARAAGFAETSLGENILRTETAVLAAMAILGFVLG
jgi:16S rRNA (uracil1498-N3)-methyltransferase